MANTDLNTDPFAAFIVKTELVKPIINEYNKKPFTSGDLASLVIKLATHGIQILPAKTSPLPEPYAVIHEVRVSETEIEPNYLVELK